jgi:hypothetical protein
VAHKGAASYLLSFQKKGMTRLNKMITILFCLGISLTQVSAGAPKGTSSEFDWAGFSKELELQKVEIEQCIWVNQIWEKVSAQKPRAALCCSSKGGKSRSSGIPGVTCDSDGKVTKIDWTEKGLSGSIPGNIGKLTSLTHL